MYSELWVCFDPPPQDPPPQVLVLAFLPPAVEAEAAERLGPQLVSGRALAQEVRGAARSLYLDLIARIGAAPAVGGKTLRQALLHPAGYSRWWFLKVSEKDCVWDGDQTYSLVIRLLCVRAVMEKHGLQRVTVYGGRPELAAALGLRGRAARRLARRLDVVTAVALGIASRIAFLAASLRLLWGLRRLPAPTRRFDVLLEAHWDWSLGPAPDGELRERYFADLPRRLAERGISVGWLASLEPRVEVWQRGRAMKDVIAPLARYPDVVLLERALTAGDVVAASCAIRPPIQILRALASPALRGLCRVNGLDLYPLVRRQLLAAVASFGVCRWDLLATATAATCGRLQPRALVTFLELFLHSRALYAGARRGRPGITVWCAQHAAYSSDKTFGVMEPSVELRGEPDGCAVPAPDGLCVMGELSQRIWRGNGFPDDRVVVTGGLRYQGVAVTRRAAPGGERGSISVLLIVGMNEEADLDMCDAAAAAARGFGVRLRLRDHPQYALSRRAGFVPYRGAIEVTAGTADRDLAESDLVLFTHSGLAEEALLRGIPTWQWLWPGFNTSVFLDLPVVPSFTSVAGLRAALAQLVADPRRWEPDRETQELVLRECFGPAPARASERVAETLASLIDGTGRRPAPPDRGEGR